LVVVGKDDDYVVFPAGAGVILAGILQEELEMGFPRRCGGDPAMGFHTTYEDKFSPQVRG